MTGRYTYLTNSSNKYHSRPRSLCSYDHFIFSKRELQYPQIFFFNKENNDFLTLENQPVLLYQWTVSVVGFWTVRHLKNFTFRQRAGKCSNIWIPLDTAFEKEGKKNTNFFSDVFWSSFLHWHFYLIEKKTKLEICKRKLRNVQF